MKRLYLSVLWTFLVVFSIAAKEVTVEQAKQYAAAFMQAKGIRSVQFQSVETGKPSNGAFYVLNLQPKGWVIVAADDAVTPIIGYSKTGTLNLNQLPDNMCFMLHEYEAQIKKIASMADTPHRAWKSVSALTTRAAGQEIKPLIKVMWDQGDPYNAYCPRQKALVGCVAVAMSQAMSVQQWPPRPQGQVSYTSVNYGGLSIDFDAERAYNWNDIMTEANNKDEVARLLYHAGMSVHMDYGEDGSGIPSNEVNRISDALVKHFSYPESVQYVWRDNYEGDWEQMLINELSAGRAIVYNAVDTKNHAGHSFNVDGYDGNGHFSVNWGWSGYGNGYFSIDNLRDQAMNMDYDAFHVAVIGIGAPNQVLKGISLNNSRIEEGLPAGSVVGAVLVNNEVPKAEYEITVHGTYNPATQNYKTVPFSYEKGMLVTTEPLQVSQKQWDIEITVKEHETKSQLTQGFRILVDPWRSLEDITQLEYNRQTKEFQLTTKHNVTYSLKAANGQVLKEGALSPMPILKWNVSLLMPGENVLELKCADEKKSIRIISNKQ